MSLGRCAAGQLDGLALDTHRQRGRDGAGPGLVTHGQAQARVARPLPRRLAAGVDSVGDYTRVLTPGHVGHVAEVEKASGLAEPGLVHTCPVDRDGLGVALGPALHGHVPALLHLLELLNRDAGPVQDGDLQLSFARLPEAVVCLAEIRPCNEQ